MQKPALTRQMHCASIGFQQLYVLGGALWGWGQSAAHGATRPACGLDNPHVPRDSGGRVTDEHVCDFAAIFFGQNGGERWHARAICRQ